MKSITRIRFKNFKRFEQFSLTCTNANILVGPNNAGKSSILDALRILYGAYRHARRISPRLIKSSDGDAWGYEIPESAIPIDTTNIATNYTDESAIIEFFHENGSKLTIEIHPSHVARLYIRDAKRNNSTGKSYFSHFPVDIVIVPTLSPFEQYERYVSDETVDRNRATRLSSRHFRNMWKRSTPEEFLQFSELVESTWPGISISKPHLPSGSQSSLEMFYREGRTDREISWSGFGFQVWLQILSHALRGNTDSIFVLDEPDVYLHPDLQRKLVSFISSRFQQYFIATHSTEIINYVEPGDIVSINSKFKASKRIKSDSEYNDLFAYIGSIENVELSKISRAKRVVFFEGKDKKILMKFCQKMGVSQSLTDGNTLIISVGGFGQWRKVLETAWTFRNVLQVDVKILALFDRDYRDSREIAEMVSEVSLHDAICLVWDRKEIENYALEMGAIARALVKRSSKSKSPISSLEAIDIALKITENYKHSVFGNILSNSLAYEKKNGSKSDPSTITSSISHTFDDLWKSTPQRLGLIPGKQFIADLSTYTQLNHGFSISMTQLIDEMNINEFGDHIRDSMKTIDEFCRS